MFLSLAVFAPLFLIFCVYQNRKSGFQRVRPTVSILEEGFIWLESMEAKLSEEIPVAAARPVNRPLPVGENAVAAQLFNLNTALGDSCSPAPAPNPAPVEAPETLPTRV